MIFLLLLSLCSCQFYQLGCRHGQQILIAKKAISPITNQTIYIKTYGCYCPYEYMGSQCQIHINLACNLQVNKTSFQGLSGEMVAQCIDYTGGFYEGVKPDIQDGSIPNNFKILWTNNTYDYDQNGDLVNYDAQNMTISFDYDNIGSKYSFMRTYFTVETSLVPWSNGLRHQPICKQQIDANVISGKPFQFQCNFNLKDYKQYSNYGVYTLQSFVIAHTNTIPRMISIRSARHHLYDSQYVESGTWRSYSPAPIGLKILALVISSVVIYLCYIIYRRWKNQSNNRLA